MNRQSVFRAAVSFLAGLVLFAAFEPIAWWPSAFAALALFLWSLSEISLSGRALCGLCFGLGFYLPLIHWSSVYVGWLPWVALALLQTLFVVAVATFLSPKLSPLAIASLWVAMESLLSRFPWGGFGWGRIAFSQAESPLAVVTSLGGVPLLTFTIVLITAAVLKREWKYLAVLLILPLAILMLPSPSQETTRIAAVQGNVPRLGLDFNAQREAVLENHLRATVQLTRRQVARSEIDLVVWPENASDVDPYGVAEKISSVVDAINIPVVVGGIPHREGKLLNASILWLPRVGPTSEYVKQELVPFAEFMPLRAMAERLVPEAKRVTDFSSGERMVVHRAGRIVAGPVICFEVINDGIVRSAVDLQANLLLVQTNSATFGRSSESAQQLAVARMRAIEHQRSIVSVSTSGISALITPEGKILSRSEIFREATLIGQLPLQSAMTVSDRLGGWPEILMALLWIPCLIRRWWTR